LRTKEIVHDYQFLLHETFAHGDLTMPKFGSPRRARLADGQVETDGVTLEPGFFRRV
jgi:hypothetical protein